MMQQKTTTTRFREWALGAIPAILGLWFSLPNAFAQVAPADDRQGPNDAHWTCIIEAPSGFADGNYITDTWPGGIVPYRFHDNVSPENRAKVEDAVAEIEAVSYIDFVECTLPCMGYPDRILIKSDPERNQSAVGRQTGEQILLIASWTHPDVRFIIVHELVHGLGLWHEQQRIDRDQYVQINYANIDPSRCDPSCVRWNFDIIPWAIPYRAYDFDSVMHYSQCAWSICSNCPSDPANCRTITVLPPYQSRWQSQIGQLDHLSCGDIGVLRFLYGAATLHVPSPYATIQSAIDAALCGDTIVVAAGTYYELINFNGKAITLRSASGNPNDTIIDGSGLNDSVVKCISGEGRDTILIGFTIQNGTAADGGGMRNFSSSPTVTNCIFRNNSASNGGGGMSNRQGSSPSVIGCTFSQNSTPINVGGAGMHNVDSSPEVTDCTFTENTTGSNGVGAGMFCVNSNPVVASCVFSNNSADDGGAMFITTTSNPSIINCVFVDNDAFGGDGTGVAGAVACSLNSNALIVNCTFLGNVAQHIGGAIWIKQSSPRIKNCTFSGNVAANSGGGVTVWPGSSPELTNCILWGDFPDEISAAGATPVVTYSCIQGGVPGPGNIDADPLFVDPNNGDLHLLPGSPCIDTGDPSLLPPGGRDLDGNMRVWNGRVDMGAYEFGSHGFGDLNCDGAFNGGDIDPFFLGLGDPAAYALAFPNCDPLLGDMNADGRLDGGDIDPFFACLGGNCP